MKNLKSTKSRFILSLAFLIVLFGGLIPTLGIFRVGSQSAKASDVTITEFPLSYSDDPHGITTGSDGNLWFAEGFANKIGKITPSGTFTAYNVPTPNSSPFDITSGPDGNVWFTEFNGNKIGKITPSGVITEYLVPINVNGDNLRRITTGPDGNLWFTDWGSYVGKITPSGNVTEYPVPTTGSFPDGITKGPDGNLWFTEGVGPAIVKLTPNGTMTEYPVPTTGSFPTGITSGPDGNLWFTERDGNKIGQITPNGTITEFPIPTSDAYSWFISPGPDGNLWFTEDDSNKIGRITPSGVIIEYSVSTPGSGLLGITSGPDGNVWFAESSGRIGVVHLSISSASGNVYVALGDSYSSGEGIRPFFEDENIESCHRSTLAYPTQIKVTDTENFGKTYYSLRNTAGYGWGFNACSGDTSTVVDNSQLISNANDINPNFLPLSKNTKLVTITAGGDDLKFADALKFCALNNSDNCANDKYQDGKTLAQWAEAQMGLLEPKLTKLYTDIRNDAPNARILVVGYPQLFPLLKQEQDCVQLKQRHIIGTPFTLGYSNKEQDFFRAKDAELNYTISKAVLDSRLTNIEFVSVDFQGGDGFAGHEVCGNGGAWMNGPSVEVIIGQINWSLSIKDIEKELKAHDYSFHPKIAGQAAYANIINTLLQGIPA